MTNEKLTVWQRLGDVFKDKTPQTKQVNQYNIDARELIKTTSKEEFDVQKLQKQQSIYLHNQWVKVDSEMFQQAVYFETTRIAAYSDFEAMEFYPELSAALDIMMEESTQVSDKGKMLNIYSESDRVKKVLEDLFFKRLNIHTSLPMWTRNTCKYGDDFVYLQMDDENGITGAKQLPNIEIERWEGDLYSSMNQLTNTDGTIKPNEVKFIWKSREHTFKPWQIAHFRLLTDDRRLPYGVSMLEKARRIYKQLMLAEDAMLIYRVTRAPERRVFKVFVGNLDDPDIEPYVNQVANKFKRTPLIDPQTGQMNLRYNQMPVWKDSPIPLLDGRVITIEELSNEWKSGKENYVYSVQDDSHKIVAGKVIWCDKNYSAESMIKVWLDDDTYVVTAPEHPFILRDGSKKRADELKPNDSLMPFYKRIDENNKTFMGRYETIYNPNSGKFEKTHRIIAEENIKEKKEYNTVHHKNFNKYDNSPTNLEWMDFFETITEFINEQKRNHKVKSIEFIEGDDVYCMTVVGQNNEDDRHNFACLSFKNDGNFSESGVFLGNSQDQDYFVPVRDQNAPNPIDTLPGAQNLSEIQDIEYLQKKMFTAIRVPKTFLGFEEAVGEGKNLALQDIRFARTIGRIQQSMLQELNKIAIIHLYILGLEDELDNFTLTMNNPSTQAEMLKIEHTTQKIQLYKDAVADAGNGFGPMSMTKAKKDILNMSNDEIILDLEQQRLEKAAAAELANTAAVIKTTGLFDKVDKIYGEPGAQSTTQGAPENESAGGSMGGGSSLGGSLGGSLGSAPLESTPGGALPPEMNEPEATPAEMPGSTPLPGEAPAPEPGQVTPESINKKDNLLLEQTEKLRKRKEKYNNMYFDKLMEYYKVEKEDSTNTEVDDIIHENEEKVNKQINDLKDMDKFIRD